MTFSRFFVQTSGLALAVGLLSAFTPRTAVAPLRSAANATLVAGDVAPGRLFPRAVPEQQRQAIAPGRVSVSNPLSPRLPLQAPLAPETWRSKSTVLHVPPGSKATELVLPIDTPQDAWVLLIPKAKDEGVGQESLRDVQLFNPRGLRVDPRADRAGQDELGLEPDQQRAGRIARPVSLLRLSPDMGAGAYTLRVGARAAAVGLAIDVRVPASPLELSLTASAMQLFPGDDVHVKVGLGAERTEGVRIEAALYNPRFERDRAVPVVQVDGEYRALVSSVLTERDEPGAWVLEVRATGTSNGRAFDRLAQTAVGFVVPTARITSAGNTRLVRDESGKVKAFEVDVVVESQARDRYEVTGSLVATNLRKELPLAEAQVTDQLGEGTHTLTLRFDAGQVGLSHVGGAYSLRDLRLFSLGTNTLYHRLGKALELSMPEAALEELAAPEMTPALKQMVDEGQFTVVR
jgi:hypothetical protein